MPTCKDCGHSLPTTSGLNKHIASSKSCRQKWQDRLKSFSVNVFDIVQGYSAGGSLDEEDEDEQVHTMVDGPDVDVDEPEIPASADTVPQREHRRVHVEEVPDSDAPMRHASDDTRWIEPYPVDMLAGAPIGDPAVAIPTKFDNIRHQLESNGDEGVLGPFKDDEEWQLAKWLIQNVGQNQTDKFLKLPIVSHIEFQRFPYHTHPTKIQSRGNLSYTNNRSFLTKIDALPTTGPAWQCDIIKVAGDQVDANGDMMSAELELWRRDPVTCVRELIGNPTFKDMMAYAPEHAYADNEGKCRIYDEMWTCDWWWETQVSEFNSH